MGVSKFEYFGNTLFDLTSDTVTSGSMLDGVVAHDAKGDRIVGSIINNGDVSNIIYVTGTESSITIPAGYTSGGTIRAVIVTHYYYSGVKMPKLPDEAAAYPYQFIRKNNSTGYYDLVLCSSQVYRDGSAVKDGGAAGSDKWYRLRGGRRPHGASYPTHPCK